MKKLFLLSVALFCVSGICYAKGKHKPRKESSSKNDGNVEQYHTLREVALENVFKKIEDLLQEINTNAEDAAEVKQLVKDIYIVTSYGKYFLWQPASSAQYQMYIDADQECP